MTAGLSHKLNILERSPLDDQPQPEGPEPAAAVEGQWVASRFNVQATTEDGRLVLWNTFWGAMSVFPATARNEVRGLLKRTGVEVGSNGIAGYLTKKGFLVQEQADEYRTFQLRAGRHLYRQDTLDLTLLSTEDCNFRCEYCYEKFARGTMLPWVRNGIKKLVESRLDHLRVLRISWFGGEPLYGMEAIQDLAPYFARVTEERGIHLSSSMTTNGYLLTPSVADNLLAWKIRAIQITIDGAPEDHDRLRHTRTGEGSFATIFENLTSLAQRPDDFRIVVRVNFDPASHEKLDDFLDMLAGLFRNDSRFRLLIRPVGRWGGDNDPNLSVCDFEDSRRVTQAVAIKARERGLEDYDNLRGGTSFGSHVCYAAKPYQFIVGAHGTLMKCTQALDTDPRNIVGQLKPDGALELDVEKLAAWTEPVHAQEQQCRSCVILPQCQGMACPYQRVSGKQPTPCPPVRKELRHRLVLATAATTHETKTTRVRRASTSPATQDPETPAQTASR